MLYLYCDYSYFFPFFICIEDTLNGFKLPDGINSKQFNIKHFMSSISELLCYIYHTSVPFIHTCRLSSRQFATKWKTNKDVYLVFTHPKHLQPLIIAHLNVNWLNYSQHPLNTLSPHPVVSRHYGKWKVRCDPGVTHSHTRAPSLSPCPEGDLQQAEWAGQRPELGSILCGGPWTCAGPADPKHEVQGVSQVPPSRREPAGTETPQTKKTSCRGSLETTGGENQEKPEMEMEGKKDRGAKRASQHIKSKL